MLNVASEIKRLLTMQEVAEADENLLYKLFGIDAELLIDHAWGRETVEIRDIKAYRPKENSISGGQVLPRDYEFGEGKMIAKEMADLLSLELVEKGCLTDSVTLHVGYSNRLNKGPAHGTAHLTTASNSARRIIACTGQLYDRIVDPFTPIRRMTLTFNHVTDEAFRQYDLFTDPLAMEKERSLMKAMLDIKEKYGKNAVLRGMDLQKGATTIERNQQIGGHKSGTA